MGISNLNKGSKFKFSYNKDDVTYMNTKEYVQQFGLDQVMIMRACHINRNGKYGPQATVIATKTNNGQIYGINLPSHMVDLVEVILDSPEYINEIDELRAGIQAYAYVDKDGNDRYSFKFVDLA
jgi:hypothetical protein